MLTIRMDGSDAIRKHAALQQQILAAYVAAGKQAGEVNRDAVRDNLKSKILRPNASSGILDRAIDSEVVRRGGSMVIGTGNIEKLNKVAPYWRLQDEGGPIESQVVPGFFVSPGGQVVPFDQARAPLGGQSTSEDIFIYTGGLWGTAIEHAFAGEHTPHSIMYVKRPVMAKHYFDAGSLAAWSTVLNIFVKAFRSAFR